METAKLLICGDIIPTESNEQLMIDGKVDELLSDVKSVFDASDFTFVNVEGVFTERGTAIEKCGPNLRGKPAAARFLKDAGVDLVGLANNHSLDWGKEGLIDTFTTLQGLGIPTVGAGYDASAARRPYRFTLKGHEITLIDVAEHEFTIAAKDRAGANPFDPYDTIEDIEAEKKAGRTVIVIYHGGKEHYRMTSPNTRRRCRKMAEHGADFIFCQHTHCVSCYEEYHGCHICYGQGNTLFDHSNAECWKTELLPVITLCACGRNSVEFIPVCQEGGKLHLAKGEEFDAIMKPFWERSAKVGDDDYLEACWKEFYMQNGRGMLKMMGLIGENGMPADPHMLSVLSNYFRCEIHHESNYSYIEEARRQHYGNLLVKGQED